MNLELELVGMQLIKDNFTVFAEPLTTISNVKNQITISLSLGTAFNDDDDNEVDLAAKYTVTLRQIDKDTNQKITEDNVEYIFVFKDKTNELIPRLTSQNLNDSELNKLVNNLQSIVYPYIREYLETRYKKANIELNLPLNFSENPDKGE